MHLHAVTMIYVPAQIYICYMVIPAVYTDWIQNTLQDVSRAALFGGFSMGECCSLLNEDHGLTTELTKHSGIVIFVLMGSWILLGVVQLFNSYCLNVE